MDTDDKEGWRIEYDPEFARWFRHQRFKPFVLICLSTLGFILDMVAREPGFGSLIGLILLTIAFGNTMWKEHNLKESYTCQNCAAKLNFSEPNDENEIRYSCFKCRIEYRVQI